MCVCIQGRCLRATKSNPVVEIILKLQGINYKKIVYFSYRKGEETA